MNQPGHNPLHPAVAEITRHVRAVAEAVEFAVTAKQAIHVAADSDKALDLLCGAVRAAAAFNETAESCVLAERIEGAVSVIGELETARGAVLAVVNAAEQFVNLSRNVVMPNPEAPCVKAFHALVASVTDLQRQRQQLAEEGQLLDSLLGGGDEDPR